VQDDSLPIVQQAAACADFCAARAANSPETPNSINESNRARILLKSVGQYWGDPKTEQREMKRF
jgi:hypothetical protein